MPLPPENPGWGLEHRLEDHPLTVGTAMAERCRQLAWWSLLEARWGGSTTLDLITEYQVPTTTRTEAEAMGRLLGLLRELRGAVLPRLEHAVRCEAVCQLDWSHQPGGGRVDPLRTFQASPLSARAPERWAVVRVHRHADTPANRFAAAVLRYAERLLDAIMARFGRRGRPFPSALSDCHRALRRLLGHGPLGSIPIDARDDPGVLLGHAHRRRAELARLGPVVSWWHQLRAVELVALHGDEGDGLVEVPLHRCYELMHAMALLGAVRQQFPGTAHARGNGLELHDDRGRTVSLRFDEQPLLCGRSPTAVLRVRRGEHEQTVFVEARNASSAAAGSVAAQLMVWCQLTPRSSAALVLPADPVTLSGRAVLQKAGVRIAIDPLLEGHSMPDLVAWWSRQLAQLLERAG